MKINLLLISALSVGLVLGVGGAQLWLTDRDHQSRLENETGHDDHDDHEGRNDHEGHDDHIEIVKISSSNISEFGIEIQTASAGLMIRELTLPGEVVLNADKVAHIVPRVSGIVKRVDKRLGDQVILGEIMAVLESRELAEAKSVYLAGKQRLQLSQVTLSSSEKLQAKGILPALEFLQIRQNRDELEIEIRTIELKLHALGLSREEINDISQENDASFSYYELTAPFAGTIIEKHITLGEAVDGQSNVFLLADLDTVWVNITVYQKDLSAIRVGQSIIVSAGYDIPEVSGIVDYVSPVVMEETRTATARVVLSNLDGYLRPGLFVNARVEVETKRVSVRIPRTAIVRIENHPCVFVESDDGFEIRKVSVGRSSDNNIEITQGLYSGERFVATGGFILKAELEKSGAAHQH